MTQTDRRLLAFRFATAEKWATDCVVGVSVHIIRSVEIGFVCTSAFKYKIARANINYAQWCAAVIYLASFAFETNLAKWHFAIMFAPSAWRGLSRAYRVAVGLLKHFRTQLCCTVQTVVFCCLLTHRVRWGSMYLLFYDSSIFHTYCSLFLQYGKRPTVIIRNTFPYRTFAFHFLDVVNTYSTHNHCLMLSNF